MKPAVLRREAHRKEDHREVPQNGQVARQKEDHRALEARHTA